MTGERFIEVWVTCPDRATAEAIAEALVAAELAACANIMPAVSSIYRWKGAIERAEEVPLVLKTRASHFTEIADRVAALHPYEVPAIVATDIAFIERRYADWLIAETGTAR